jgi:hypothetical protein
MPRVLLTSITLLVRLDFQGRIAKLLDEMEFIHYANKLYWGQSSHTREARGEYAVRQDRLTAVRTELQNKLRAQKQTATV